MSAVLEKSHEKLQLELRKSLDDLGFITVKAVSSRNGDVRALFRVGDESKWLAVVAKFLANEADKNWYTFFGKRYFLVSDKLVFGWVVILDANNLQKAVDDFRSLLIATAESLGLFAGAPKKEVEQSIVVDAPTGFALGSRLQARVHGTSEQTIHRPAQSGPAAKLRRL